MLDTILTVASVIVGISGIVIFYLTYKAQGKLYQKEKNEHITKERNKLNMPNNSSSVQRRLNKHDAS
jgi:hypothetical protein